MLKYTFCIIYHKKHISFFPQAIFHTNMNVWDKYILLLNFSVSQGLKIFVMGNVQNVCDVFRTQTQVERKTSPTELSTVCFGRNDRSYSALIWQRLQSTLTITWTPLVCQLGVKNCCTEQSTLLCRESNRHLQNTLALVPWSSHPDDYTCHWQKSSKWLYFFLQLYQF